MNIKILKEFKEFAVKGNMIDIAIGVIIGSAFNKVVDALVKEIFLPPLSLLTDGISWSNKKIILRHAVTENGKDIEQIAIGYGKMVEAMIDFLIIGFTVFLVVKLMNSFKNRAHDPDDQTVSTPKDIELLSKISKSLDEQNNLLRKRNE